jgi:hypothetical protein
MFQYLLSYVKKQVGNHIKTKRKPTFKKNQRYTYAGGVTEDETLPSENAVIQIISARGKFVKYAIMHGKPPANGKEEFTRDSQMAEKLVLLQ